MRNFFLAFFLFCTYGLAGELSFPGGQLSFRVVTPHTAWAKPWVSGSLKILTIAPAASSREVLELAQRLDAEIVCVPVPAQKRFLGEVWVYLRQCLSDDYQLILLGGVRWVDLPADIRQLILRKVRGGCTFLFVDPQGMDRELYECFESGRTVSSFDAAFIIPFQKLPAFSRFEKPEELIQRYVTESLSGKGKMCCLSYASGRGEYLFLTPAGPSNQLQYDYYCAFVIRIILALTGKLSREKIEDVRLEKGKIFLQVVTDKPGQIFFRVRDREGAIEQEKKLPVSGKEVSFPFSPLPAGTHFFDFFLLRDGVILDWRSCYREETAPGEIKIFLEKEFFHPGETISGRMELSGLKGEALKLSLLDSWGRLLATKQFPVQPVVRFTLPEFEPLTVLHRVKVEVINGSDVILAAEKYFPVTYRFDQKEFFFLLWGSPAKEYLPRYLLKLAREAGVDGLFSHCETLDILKEITSCNLYPCPYIFSLKTASATKELARQPCFSHPSFRENMAKTLEEKTRLIAPFAPITYGLGDENELSHWSENKDFCFSSYCLADLREYLKKEYGSLSSLNAEWQTSFETWDQVRPVTLKQLKERKQTDNFSPWIDHRLHMEEVFANIHLHGRLAIEKIDPAAKVGAEGIWGEGNSFTGIDYSKMAVALRSVGGYGGTWLWRNFLTADSLLWDWGIYSSSVEKGYRYPWEVLLAGGNGIGFFSLFSEEPDYTAFLPDFTMYEPFAAVAGETQKIKRGLGRLFLSCEAQYSPVALVHSQPNLHLTTALSETTTFNYQKSRWALFNLLTEQWYYPAAITHRSIAKGVLEKNRYRFVFLPSLFCLSAEERQKLRLFVEKGGTVIADTLPGLFDGHGKKTDNSDMEELFGVSRGNWPVEPDNELVISGVSIPVSCAEPLKVAGGQPRVSSAAGYPAFIVRRYGAGQAICLNILLPTVDNLKPEKRAVFISFLNQFWRSLGLTPQWEVFSEKGEFFFSGKGRFFTWGENRYLFILPEKNGRVKIQWSGKGHVYDMLTGNYEGFSDSLTVSFVRERPVLGAVLPYQVKSLQVKIPLSVLRGKLLHGEIRLQTEGKSPGRHIINLVVVNPHAQEISYLSRNLDCTGGSCLFHLPLALNEQTGVWKIKARDVASGASAEASFTVKD